MIDFPILEGYVIVYSPVQAGYHREQQAAGAEADLAHSLQHQRVRQRLVAAQLAVEEVERRKGNTAACWERPQSRAASLPVTDPHVKSQL